MKKFNEPRSYLVKDKNDWFLKKIRYLLKKKKKTGDGDGVKDIVDDTEVCRTQKRGKRMNITIKF